MVEENGGGEKRWEKKIRRKVIFGKGKGKKSVEHKWERTFERGSYGYI